MSQPLKDIRTLSMIDVHKDPSSPFGFPDKTRESMIGYLVSHASHACEGFHLSWDIKVRNFDRSGKTGGEAVDPAFDARWERYAASEPDLFRRACDDALTHYLDGTWDVDAGAHRGTAKFVVVGRSGGHLCLDEWTLDPRDGPIDMRFRDKDHFRRWLDGLADPQISALYRLVAVADVHLKDPAAEVAWQYNARRAAKELEWAGEAAAESLTRRETGT